MSRLIGARSMTSTAVIANVASRPTTSVAYSPLATTSASVSPIASGEFSDNDEATTAPAAREEVPAATDDSDHRSQPNAGGAGLSRLVGVRSMTSAAVIANVASRSTTTAAYSPVASDPYLCSCGPFADKSLFYLQHGYGRDIQESNSIALF